MGIALFVTACLCHSFLLTRFPFFTVGLSLKLQSFMNCSCMCPSQRLQLFKNSSNTGPLHGLQSCRKTAPIWVPFRPQLLPNCSSMGSSPWAVVHAKSLFQCGLSMDCSFLQGISTCSSMGSSMGLQGDNLLHHAPLCGLQGILCSSTWSTSEPFFSDLEICRVVFLTLFLTPHRTAVQCFLLFLKYAITEMPPVLMIRSALVSGVSILELAVNGSLHH